jgi:hypothetical protein
MIQVDVARADADQHADLYLLLTFAISDGEVLNGNVADAVGDADDGLEAASTAVANDKRILVSKRVGLTDQRDTPVNDHILKVGSVSYVNRIAGLGGIDRRLDGRESRWDGWIDLQDSRYRSVFQGLKS